MGPLTAARRGLDVSPLRQPLPCCAEWGWVQSTPPLTCALVSPSGPAPEVGRRAGPHLQVPPQSAQYYS